MRVSMKSLARKLAKDESGTALMEYSILLGMIAVAVIASVTLASGWVTTQWNTLTSNLPAAAPAP